MFIDVWRDSIFSSFYRVLIFDGVFIETVFVIQASNFIAKMDKKLIRNFDQVMANYETGKEQIIEARVTNHPTRIDGDYK